MIIDKLAFLHIENKRLLLARSRGNDTYYIPGGKREAGESDEQTLIREIKEELSVDLIPSTVQYAATFQTQAHGKPDGTEVKMTCYTGKFEGAIQAAAEIEEVAWYEEGMQCSRVTQMIIQHLQLQQLIETTCRYEWILFDADETLFRFDDFRGLQTMFLGFGVDFTVEDYKAYKTINEALWKSYQNHKITIHDIRQQRFQTWSEKLAVTPETLNHAFLTAMSEICEPLDGAISLLQTLKNKGVKLGIITNGFTDWQEIRLARLGLTGHIDLLVTSEQAGVAKPHRDIFDHALTRMGSPSRERVLMVGDNPHSDIKGGIDAEFHTCWLNAYNKPVLPEIRPTYQVTTLVELGCLLFDKKQQKSAIGSGHSFWEESVKQSAECVEKSIAHNTMERDDATCQY